MFSSQEKKSEIAIRKSLEIPPDLARPGGPDAKAPAPLLSAAPRPAGTPDSSTNSAVDSTVTSDSQQPKVVELRRDGSVRWLIVRDTPAAAWRRIRDYFVTKEIKLSEDDPKGLILETDWIDRPVNMGSGVLGSILTKVHSSGLRDKYRVRVEAGRDPGFSEIYVSHRLLEEIVTEGGGTNVVQTRWFPRPGDPQMEAEFLNRLLTYMGGSDKSTDMAKTGAGGSRPDIVKDKNGILIKSAEFDAVWRRVGLVLDRSGAIVEDQDRTTGTYYVQYRSSRGKEKTVFSWFTGDDSTDGKDKPVSVRYQVVVKAVPDGVQISLNDVAGDPATTRSAQELLSAIEKQF